MPRLPVTILVTALVLSLAGTAAAVPMGDLHCNDWQGRPAAPYTIGTPVTVTGIVTAGTGTFVATRTEIYVQDATGAVMIYKSTVPATFATGDSVTFSGTIDQYRGHTEVALNTWTNHSSGHLDPVPRTMTCYQVANEFGANYCEPEESMLIRLARVTYTGTWAANQVVTLHDETGTCDMYIYGPTGVGSMPPPPAHFDVIGVLKQFGGFSPPFTSGYEVLPRSPADVTPLPGPAITAGPEETEITPNAVTIAWTTDVPADSRIDYGYTTGYELGTVYDPAQVTQHSATLSGLEPARMHIYRVTSTNLEGEIALPGLRFCSGSRSSGETRVYFNKSVDTSLAIGEAAQGNVDFQPILISRINAAQHSIDVAIYSFDLAGPADALIAAFQRGVEVRFITEHRDNPQQQVLRLVSAGITVIDDAYGPNNAGGGLMHDKFWVFDHRLETDPSDDWIMTGSWNMTNEGTYTDAQNIILIQDESLAEVYTAEVNEMWGSTTATPDPDLSRFGVLKLDDTPKKFMVGGYVARVYFGPSDNTMGVMANRCAEAEFSAHFCIYSFTRYDVGNALKDRYYTVPGFAVRGVFDSSESGNASSQYHEMIGGGDYPWNPPADVWLDTEYGTLHNKYMILDVNRRGGRPTVVTGSSNWSNAANNENDENQIYVEDFRVANLYFQEFANRYHAAGGSADLTTDVLDRPALSLAPTYVFPNPTTNDFVLRLAPARPGLVSISLHDPAGRRISGRQVNLSAPGTSEVTFDTQEMAPGIYFLRISGPGIQERRTLTVLR